MGEKTISSEKVATRLKSAKSRAKIEDLADTLIQKFGGLEKFAQKYVDDYDAAKMGSVTRARLLDGAMKLMQFCGKKDNAPGLDEISDEDLQDQIQQHLDKLLKATPIVDLVSDATPIPTETGADGTPTT